MLIILYFVGLGFLLYNKKNRILCKESETKVGGRRKDLPDFRQADITSHNTEKKGIWVTYKDGVYDITQFIESHPGGKKKILLAAGGQLEPFWEMFAQHQNPEVYEILEELRIGNIHPDDKKGMVTKKGDDPYRNDPKRHPALKVNSNKPFNAETPEALLCDNFITPNELFFVRNHLPVPKVDKKNYKLEIMGEGLKKSMSFGIDELSKKFKVITITAALQCAGNRRSEMGKAKPVKGLTWNTCAISNAEWTGVKLCDILESAGFKEKAGYHVIFQGLDKDMEGIPYEASIPIETAMDPKREVLLGFKMNGKEIPVDHGYPLRIVVPGSAGARQVKWVSKVIVSPTESTSHWQQNDYKTFNPSTDWDTVDFSKAVAIQDYPIQSAICEPQDKAVLEDEDEVTVAGYAWSGGGRGIIRVEVSIDGGKTWHEAKLQNEDQRLHRQWAWTLWNVAVPIDKKLQGKLNIICKAVDTSHNQQPESAEGIWNLRGLINNAWHRIEVTVPK